VPSGIGREEDGRRTGGGREEDGRRTGGGRGGGRADTELKTKTPHVNVGEKVETWGAYFGLRAAKASKILLPRPRCM